MGFWDEVGNFAKGFAEGFLNEISSPTWQCQKCGKTTKSEEKPSKNGCTVGMLLKRHDWIKIS